MVFSSLKNKLATIFKLKSVSERFEYLNPEKKSYSQSGEDLIVDYVFFARGVNKISYLDIGANHPSYLNNTYIFYLRGCVGVNIEPNPRMIEKFLKIRPNDTSVLAGASTKEGYLTYYEMDTPELNTFSKEHVSHLTQKGNVLIREASVPVLKINSIIEKYFQNKSPNVIFIDAEGMDFELVASIDFEKYRPEVLCVESISYELNGRGIKDVKLIDYVCSKGYFLYADTNINSIFVREDFWMN